MIWSKIRACSEGFVREVFYVFLETERQKFCEKKALNVPTLIYPA